MPYHGHHQAGRHESARGKSPALAAASPAVFETRHRIPPHRWQVSGAGPLGPETLVNLLGRGVDLAVLAVDGAPFQVRLDFGFQFLRLYSGDLAVDVKINQLGKTIV